MDPDDPVCLCFHVTRRKILRFIRVEKPRRTSQLSECFGAGTGCGWCIPYLERLMQQQANHLPADRTPPSSPTSLDRISLDEYRQAREIYRREKESSTDEQDAGSKP